MKKLIELYGMNETDFDALSKNFSAGRSVANKQDPNQARARTGTGGAVQRAQADLDQSQSLAKREEVGGEKTVNLPLTEDQIEALTRELHGSMNPEIKAVLLQIEVLSQTSWE